MDNGVKNIVHEQAHFSKPILHTENLTIGYMAKPEPFVLEANLNIKIYNGELVCLIGPNGCGKSTLMRTIAGLQKPLAGKTYIEDKALKSLPQHKYARLLSLVLTDKINAGALKVKDVVAVGRYPYINYFARLQPEDYRIINRSLEMVHLESYAERHFAELSDGEKQRTMIAKALAQDTPLIMLDEPTAHLDLPNRVEIMNILKKLAKETNKAILLSTHELDLALQSADSLWLMQRNHDMQYGVPEDLVLNGAFEKVFSSNSFDFDKSTGAFKVRHEAKGNITLTGKGIDYLWTKRALEREAYHVDKKDTNKIRIDIEESGKWQLTIAQEQTICNSIGDVLCHLRTHSAPSE